MARRHGDLTDSACGYHLFLLYLESLLVFAYFLLCLVHCEIFFLFNVSTTTGIPVFVVRSQRNWYRDRDRYNAYSSQCHWCLGAHNHIQTIFIGLGIGLFQCERTVNVNVKYKCYLFKVVKCDGSLNVEKVGFGCLIPSTSIHWGID